MLEALGRGHHAVADVRATLLVANLVQRKQDLGAELARLLQHRIDRIGIQIRVLRQLLQFGFDVQQFVQHELHIAQRCGVLSHDSLRFD